MNITMVNKPHYIDPAETVEMYPREPDWKMRGVLALYTLMALAILAVVANYLGWVNYLLNST